MTGTTQWIRQASLVLSSADQNLDLSEMHFRFRTQQSNEESPNTLAVRVYNLSDQTVKAITSQSPVEYTSVELKAGYVGGSLGTLFAGTVKQYRRGRENATDTYLDILAAADDPEYNLGVVNDSIPAGTPRSEIANRAAKQMGLEVGYIPPDTGGTLPRGKVLWGMGRVMFRNLATTSGMGWSIQNGKIILVPLDSYLPGEVVEINSATGMIGIPEQTDQGLQVRCLINPKLYIGGQIHVNNEDVNQIMQAGKNPLPVGQVPYDQWAGLTLPADITRDGFYMAYVIEHTGDTRGNEWYSDIIGLAMSGKGGKVQPYATGAY